MALPAQVSSAPVDKDDIFLLLESYKNNIELTSTLLEQQKQLLNQQSEVIKKQNTLCDTMNKLLDKFDMCYTNANNIQTKLLESQGEIKKDVSSCKTDIKTDISGVKTTILTDHNKLALLIYGMGGGLITLIISLIGFMYIWSDRFSLMKDIAVKVGVVLH